MKKQKARGQVRRFLRRSIACLLAIVGMGMAAVTAGLPQPLGWLGGLGGIQTAMAAQAPAGDGPVPFWQRLLPAGLDTEDLLVMTLLLLIAGDQEDHRTGALLTLALYFFL